MRRAIVVGVALCAALTGCDVAGAAGGAIADGLTERNARASFVQAVRANSVLAQGMPEEDLISAGKNACALMEEGKNPVTVGATLDQSLRDEGVPGTAASGLAGSIVGAAMVALCPDVINQ